MQTKKARIRHITPCFVCIEDADKRKEMFAWLGRIGYNSYDWYWGEYIRIIRCWTSPKGISKAVGYPCKQVRKTDIDCGTDIELFKALAAMNNNNDLEQWFTDGENWVLCTDPQMSKSVIPNYDAYRKATAEEILKHSKALFSRQH